jgi:hypothetical protein
MKWVVVVAFGDGEVWAAVGLLRCSKARAHDGARCRVAGLLAVLESTPCKRAGPIIVHGCHMSCPRRSTLLGDLGSRCGKCMKGSFMTAYCSWNLILWFQGCIFHGSTDDDSPNRKDARRLALSLAISIHRHLTLTRPHSLEQHAHYHVQECHVVRYVYCTRRDDLLTRPSPHQFRGNRVHRMAFTSDVVSPFLSRGGCLEELARGVRSFIYLPNFKS